MTRLADVTILPTNQPQSHHREKHSPPQAQQAIMFRPHPTILLNPTTAVDMWTAQTTRPDHMPTASTATTASFCSPPTLQRLHACAKRLMSGMPRHSPAKTQSALSPPPAIHVILITSTNDTTASSVQALRSSLTTGSELVQGSFAGKEVRLSPDLPRLLFPSLPRFSMINCRDFRRSLYFPFHPTAAIFDDQVPRFSVDKNSRQLKLERCISPASLLTSLINGIILSVLNALMGIIIPILVPRDPIVPHRSRT